MATVKTHDLCVAVSQYTDRDGKTRNRYKNCGMILHKDDGGEFILIDPTFNFAGVHRDPDRDMIIVSKFEVKDSNDNKQAPAKKAEEQVWED